MYACSFCVADFFFVFSLDASLAADKLLEVIRLSLFPQRIIHYPNESQRRGHLHWHQHHQHPPLPQQNSGDAFLLSCCAGRYESSHSCLYLLLRRHSPRLAGAGSTNTAATVLAVCKSFASICKCIGACASCGRPLLQKSLGILFDGGAQRTKQGIC